MKSKKNPKNPMNLHQNPYEFFYGYRKTIKRISHRRTKFYKEYACKKGIFLFFLKIIYIAPVSKIDVPVNF